MPKADLNRYIYRAMIGFLFVLIASETVALESGRDELHKVKIVEGTDPIYEANVRERMDSDPGFQRDRAADRTLVRAERKAMQKAGYIVADESCIDIHDAKVVMPNRASQVEVMPYSLLNLLHYI